MDANRFHHYLFASETKAPVTGKKEAADPKIHNMNSNNNNNSNDKHNLSGSGSEAHTPLRTSGSESSISSSPILHFQSNTPRPQIMSLSNLLSTIKNPSDSQGTMDISESSANRTLTMSSSDSDSVNMDDEDLNFERELLAAPQKIMARKIATWTLEFDRTAVSESVSQWLNQIDKVIEQNNELRTKQKQLKKQVKSNVITSKQVEQNLESTKRKKEITEIDIKSLEEELKRKKKEREGYAQLISSYLENLEEIKVENSESNQEISEISEWISTNQENLLVLKKKVEKEHFENWGLLFAQLQENENKAVTNASIVRNKVEEVFQKGNGIPDLFRGNAWYFMSPISQLQNETSDQLYYKMLDKDSSHEFVIKKDINRSFPNKEFQKRMLEKNSVENLFNVLKAYSNLDTAVGYTQGMNFIVSMLLIYTSQEEAFWLLLSIMKSWKMVGLYQSGPLLPHFLIYFDFEFKTNFPDLHTHFKTQNVSPVMYATEWITTMYVYTLSIETAARIWDCFFYGEGPSVLLRAGLALLKLHKVQLLSVGMEGILRILKKKVKHVNPREIMGAVSGLQLTSQTKKFLASIQVAWQGEEGSRKLTTNFTMLPQERQKEDQGN